METTTHLSNSARARRTERRTRERRDERQQIQAGPCCQRFPLATFHDQQLVSLEYRHVGKRCAGRVEVVYDVQAWLVENVPDYQVAR